MQLIALFMHSLWKSTLRGDRNSIWYTSRLLSPSLTPISSHALHLIVFYCTVIVLSPSKPWICFPIDVSCITFSSSVLQYLDTSVISGNWSCSSFAISVSVKAVRCYAFTTVRIHTGVSMQARSCVSSAWQPATLYPDDVQHAATQSVTFSSRDHSNKRTQHGAHEC